MISQLAVSCRYVKQDSFDKKLIEKLHNDRFGIKELSLSTRLAFSLFLTNTKELKQQIKQFSERWRETFQYSPFSNSKNWYVSVAQSKRNFQTRGVPMCKVLMLQSKIKRENGIEVEKVATKICCNVELNGRSFLLKSVPKESHKAFICRPNLASQYFQMRPYLMVTLPHSHTVLDLMYPKCLGGITKP